MAAKDLAECHYNYNNPLMFEEGHARVQFPSAKDYEFGLKISKDYECVMSECS